MTTTTTDTVAGAIGSVHVTTWAGDAPPTFVAAIAHGFGEHAGRFSHVAERLVSIGAAVVAPDHVGHGNSAGERAVVTDIDIPVRDLAMVIDGAVDRYPGLPLVLIGHSMGGLIATRYAQQHGDRLAALVLSGPLIGANPGVEFLLSLDPVPDIPIDPAILSRDPAVGEAYAADPLVHHGPFPRATLQAFVDGVEAVADGGSLGDLPTLWIHGRADQLVPYESVATAMGIIGGSATEEQAYPGAAHEVFNEINGDEVLDDLVTFLNATLSS